MFMAFAILAAAAPEAPTMTIQGKGTVKTAPDRAKINYRIRGEGRSSEEALKALVAKESRVKAIILHLDPAADIRAEKVSVATVRGKDCGSGHYGDDDSMLSTGSCAITGYVAVQEIEATTGRVKDAGTIVGAASQAGATDPEIERFYLADDREARARAIAQGAADAQARAQALAAATNVKLGPVQSLRLDGTRIFVPLGRNLTSVRGLVQNFEGTTTAVDMTPKEIETSAELSITYAITR